MSELLQEMTREERTRNALECDTDTLERVAEVLEAAASTVSGLARDHRGIEGLQVVEYCLWQLCTQLQEPLDSLRNLTGQYSNERTMEEAAAAIHARHSTAH